MPGPVRGSRLLVPSPCAVTHTHSTIPFHTLSIFLRNSFSFPCGRHFLPQATNGSVFCGLAEAFDTAGHLLFPRMFFLGFCAGELSPYLSGSSFSASFMEYYSLFFYLVPGLWFLGFHAQLTSPSSWVMSLASTVADPLMNPKARP